MYKLLKRAKRESPAQRARRWILEQKDLDQPGLTLLHINDTIGKLILLLILDTQY